MNMKNKILIVTVSLLLSVSSNAQQLDWGKFFAGGVDDAELLLSGYLSPYLKGFGSSLTGGWYNTAKPHKLGGFDLTFSFNTAIVPSAERNFNVNDLGLTNFVLAPGQDEMAPSIAGKNNIGPTLNYNTPEVINMDIKAFDLPKGLGFGGTPTPMIQAGVGFIKGTELMGRFMPTVNLGNVPINMWGVGAKHSLKQWIPILEKVPVLHISIMGGYTKMNAAVPISVDETDIGSSSSTILLEDGVTTAPDDVWDNQSIDLSATSFTGNLLVSADLPIVCFYGGVGFATSKTKLKANGFFPMYSGYSNGDVVVTAFEDPIDIEVKNQSGSKTKPRLNAGMRIKMGVLTIHGDYTYTNYSMVTAGVGISFR